MATVTSVPESTPTGAESNAGERACGRGDTEHLSAWWATGPVDPVASPAPPDEESNLGPDGRHRGGFAVPSSHAADPRTDSGMPGRLARRDAMTMPAAHLGGQPIYAASAGLELPGHAAPAGDLSCGSSRPRQNHPAREGQPRSSMNPRHTGVA